MLAPAFKTSNYLQMLQDLAPELADCAAGALQASRLPQLRTAISLGDQAAPGGYRFADVLAQAPVAEWAAAGRPGADDAPTATGATA